MFDQRSFSRPNDFIPTRSWYHSFHFGFGSDECLGHYIGMGMIPRRVRQLMLRPGRKAKERIDDRNGPLPKDYELSSGAR